MAEKAQSIKIKHTCFLNPKQRGEVCDPLGDHIDATALEKHSRKF